MAAHQVDGSLALHRSSQPDVPEIARCNGESLASGQVVEITLGQCVEKPRVYHGEWSPSGSPKAKTRGAAGSKCFLPRDFPRDSIHHDTPKAFPHIFILNPNILIFIEHLYP